MKFALILFTSLMTSCVVLSAPPLKAGALSGLKEKITELEQKLQNAEEKIQNAEDTVQNAEQKIQTAEQNIQNAKAAIQNKEAELENKLDNAKIAIQNKEAEIENEVEQLKEKLQVIMDKAEMELQKIESKADAVKSLIERVENIPYTLEQLVLFSQFLENQKEKNHTLADLKPLLPLEFLMNETSLTAEQLLILQKIKSGQDIDEDELIAAKEIKKLQEKLQQESSDSDSSSEENRNGEMSLEQKILEAKLLQGLSMTHQQLVRLAELRAHKSGKTTLQELFLLHNVNANITPKELIILKSFTPNQILRYYFMQSYFNFTLGGGPISSIFQELPELARAEIMLEHTELMLYNLIQNFQPKGDHPNLAELALIYRYQESMSGALRRSRFLLALSLTNMIHNDGTLTQEQKQLAVILLHRMKEQQKDEVLKEAEAVLLRRYRQGKASLAVTIEAYQRLDAMMNTGVGSRLRSMVMNKVRIAMLNGSDIAMHHNGTWKDGWLNNTEWMNATECERIQELWVLYKLRHHREFKQRHEESKRRRNFERKLSEVIMHNIEFELGSQLFSMGLNNLSDWFQEELSMLRGYIPNKATSTANAQAEADLNAQEADIAEGEKARALVPVMPYYTSTLAASSLPGYVNWSNTNWVGPVQNQYQCGSCWTFSAAGALEAQYYNKTGTFATMSEQNLLDCTYYLGNLGCDGGNVELAYEYVRTVGIDNYASYPYTGWANNGTCLYNPVNSVTQDSGWMLINEGDELSMQQAVAQVGPVSAAIDASLSSFDSYTGGVYAPANCSTTALDHAILVVGYGTTSDGQDYWLIKNSWGVDWGINGYMMMQRNVNMCGIATQALFPLIN